MRPKILVTLDTGQELRRGVAFPSVHMKAAYARAVERAGATPILAAPTADPGVIEDLATLMDGLVVTGGAFDIAPSKYGRAKDGAVRLDEVKPLRTDFEWTLLERALARGIPVLGVCGGMQLLNVVLGGTLLQDIRAEIANALEHEQPTSPATPHHPVAIAKDTALHRVLAADEIAVNTTHHQAVDRLGRGLVALGRSPDGVIEAIGHAEDLRVTGVQWHPELLDDHASRAIYGAFVEHAAKKR